MNEEIDIRGSVWLITGCSSGLGAVLATAAAARGAIVAATARRTADLDSLIESAPGQIHGFQLDVTDSAQVDRVVADVEAQLGRIDVLVNNAGRVHIGAIEEISDAELRALFDLHVFAPTDLVRAVLPGMRARGDGTIVQMSTMGAFLINPGFGAYTATKAALEGLSATLAAEVEPLGIRVLIVEPGSHRTAVFDSGRVTASDPNDAYSGTVGPTREFVGDADGNQAGDPVKLAEAVIDAVGSGEMPLRLPLGGDAIDKITAAIRAIEADMIASEELARSTRFSEPG